ncbi:MAG: Lpg1974 family pore-forming outer membrane protein [Parachlamydiaceae bacterium]
MEDGLSPGTIVTGDPYVSSDKNTINHNCKYNNGFRVNLGYELPSDSWGVGISYTYMPATARTPTFSITDLMTWAYAPNSNDFPILDPLSSISPTREVFTSRWTATLNCADVDLSRIVCLGDCLQMRPHIGFRAFWMTQRLRVNLDYTLDTATEESVDVILRQHFTSCGVEGGLWATWNIGCGFSFLGHIGGSILSSKFTIPQHATFIVMTDEDSETEILTESYIEDTIHSCTPTADYFVGLQYDDIFCEVVFSLIAGWEQHVVFDVNRLSSIPGNLATQGLTLSFKARF